ncbi:MAG: heme ABC exporter ATP-binding protein CcmA [Hyphomicrobiaceae bacterium]
MALSLVVQDVAVERGGLRVLDGLAFALAGGTVLVVTGPNGAGKTTLLRAIAGYLPVLRGSVSLLGGDSEHEVAEQLHYVGHQNAVKGAMTVRENLMFWADYLGGDQVSVARAMDDFGLLDLAEIPAAFLSAGQRRRLALGRLLVAHRPVWLLDEPTVALDGASRDRLTAIGDRHLQDNGIIVAATHLPLPFCQIQELGIGLREVAA